MKPHEARQAPAWLIFDVSQKIMRSDYSLIFYLRPKLQMSVEHLATGPGTLKARLKNVMVSHLIHLQPRRDASEVETLIADAVELATSTKDETGIAGDLHVTLASSSWRKDQKIAQNIFQAYELASKACYENARTG